MYTLTHSSKSQQIGRIETRVAPISMNDNRMTNPKEQYSVVEKRIF